MLRTAQNRRPLQESAPDGPPMRRPAPQKGGQHLLYRLIIQQWAVFRNKKADTTLKKRHPFLRGRLFSCARGAGGAGRSAAALVNADVVGTATAAFQVAAAFVVAVDIRLGRGRLVVGGDVAVPLAVAVAAADSVPGAGMADVDVRNSTSWSVWRTERSIWRKARDKSAPTVFAIWAARLRALPRRSKISHAPK